MDKYTSVEEQVYYGLEKIDVDRKVEISLRDLVFVYKMVEEFNRFFHQPMHYPTLQDVTKYLGHKDAGAYALIHRAYYEILSNYLPDDIKDKLGCETDELVNPHQPYYYKSE